MTGKCNATLRRFRLIETGDGAEMKADPNGAYVLHADLMAQSANVPGWQPIETAPKTGPVETVLLYVPTLHGTGGPVLAHWAHGGGDEQPRFGPAWFFWTGYGFRELTEKPTHWMYLPRCPADWRPARETQSASAPSAITLAEPCQRHGCRFRVAQDLLHLAQERGELAETEISSVTSSANTSTGVPLCDGHAQAWFTERNHLKGDHGCVVCAFLGNLNCPSCGRPATGVLADACGEDPCPLRQSATATLDKLQEALATCIDLHKQTQRVLDERSATEPSEGYPGIAHDFERLRSVLIGAENLLRRSLRHGLLRAESEAMLLDIEAALKNQPADRKATDA